MKVFLKMGLVAFCFSASNAFALDAYEAPPNTFLSAPLYGITHFNSVQNYTIPYAVSRWPL